MRIGERFHRERLFPPADDHVKRRPGEAQRARQIQKRCDAGINPLCTSDDARNLIQPILQNHAHIDEQTRRKERERIENALIAARGIGHQHQKQRRESIPFVHHGAEHEQ